MLRSDPTMLDVDIIHFDIYQWSTGSFVRYVILTDTV